MPSLPPIFGESLSSLSCLLSAPTCCSVASCHPSSTASASRHTTASLPAVPPPLLAPLPHVVPFFISGTVASRSTRLFSRHHLLLLVRLPSAGATTSHCATASSSYCALSCLLSPWLVVVWKATAVTAAFSPLFPTFPATVPIASTSCPHPLLPRW